MLSSRRKIDLRTFRRVARKLPRLKEMTELITHFQIFSKLASRKLRIDFFHLTSLPTFKLFVFVTVLNPLRWEDMTDAGEGTEKLDGPAQLGHNQVGGAPCGWLTRHNFSPQVPGHPLHLCQGGGGEAGEDDPLGARDASFAIFLAASTIGIMHTICTTAVLMSLSRDWKSLLFRKNCEKKNIGNENKLHDKSHFVQVRRLTSETPIYFC